MEQKKKMKIKLYLYVRNFLKPTKRLCDFFKYLIFIKYIKITCFCINVFVPLFAHIMQSTNNPVYKNTSLLLYYKQ